MNLPFDLHFLDVVVLVVYLLGTTWLGHYFAGRQSTLRDFFLAGRTVPWPAVSASIVATELSGVTFIGVPALVFAAEGNLTYLQWAIGSMMGRILVAWFFVPRFYEQEIYSPYDYMARRLGKPVKLLATILFFLGAVLGQSVRVLVASIPLRVVTGLPIEVCIIVIGVFAIIWTLLGGMRTVIWTDVIQFFVFAFGAVLALIWIAASLEGGWLQIWTTAERFDRTVLWDNRLQSHLEFTLWVALIAVPIQNLSVFGVDQMNVQRVFCCRGVREARLALVFSCFGQTITVLMLCVGLALFAYYHHHPLGDQQAAVLVALSDEEKQAGITALQKVESLPKISSSDGSEVSQVPVLPNRDYIYPMWIVQVLPPGFSGLLLAAIFAAAISSLDSVLGALSQSTLSLLYHPENRTVEELQKLGLIAKARWLVLLWGVLLVLFTLALNIIREDIPILPLAFGMTSYAVGPLLGIMLCALVGRANWRGLLCGTTVSVLLVLFLRTDVWTLAQAAGFDVSWLSFLPWYSWQENKLISLVSYVWSWPITTLLTFASGCISWQILQKRTEKNE